jgi:hypothetical protein
LTRASLTAIPAGAAGEESRLKAGSQDWLPHNHP